MGLINNITPDQEVNLNDYNDNVYIDNLRGPVLTESEWELFRTSIERRKLADKVFYCEKLTDFDRQKVYRMLTGKEPPEKKRGRPSTESRDMELAYEFLVKKKCGKVFNNTIIDLVNKYGLPVNQNMENTFYTALNRGIRHLQKVAKETILFMQRNPTSFTCKFMLSNEDIESDDDLESVSAYSYALIKPQKILTLVENYKTNTLD